MPHPVWWGNLASVGGSEDEASGAEPARLTSVEESQQLVSPEEDVVDEDDGDLTPVITNEDASLPLSLPRAERPGFVEEGEGSRVLWTQSYRVSGRARSPVIDLVRPPTQCEPSLGRRSPKPSGRCTGGLGCAAFG